MTYVGVVAVALVFLFNKVVFLSFALLLVTVLLKPPVNPKDPRLGRRVRGSALWISLPRRGWTVHGIVGLSLEAGSCLLDFP